MTAPIQRPEGRPLDARRPPNRPAIVKLTVTLYDLAAAWAAMYLGVALRYQLSPPQEPTTELPLFAATVFALICALVFPLRGLHRGVWRFTALNDVLRILQAIALANLIFLFAFFVVNRLEGVPRSSVLIEAPLLALFLITARYARQIGASGDWRSVVRLEDRSKPNALLAGGHEALDSFLRDSMRRRAGPPFRVRGLVEPTAAERGRMIRGIPVLGGPGEAERALISLAGVNGAPPQLVLVDPRLSRGDVEAFVHAASSAGAALVRARANAGGPALFPLDAADLLGRQPRQLDQAPLRGLIEGARVLVTGAGGTIGSELTRQISRLRPASLALLDSSELNLYEIDMALREAGYADNAHAYLGDVRDARRVKMIFDAERPSVVVHAAALKHVPLMEENPAEAVLTNLGGTIVVAEAARAAGADRFVLISTDKAVNPTNVMGASKRAAELFVQALDAEPDPFRAVAVRFGNVLGSTGSVVPLFERQIQQGGPITVTHPEITRYFMTVEEASALVLQAAALVDDVPQGSSVFVLDMGDPVSIDHLARQLCRLRGMEPGHDVAIVYTGLRPGEKVTERLFYDRETVTRTPVDGVMLARAGMIPLQALDTVVRETLDAARRRDRAALYARMEDLAPEFQPARAHARS